MMRGKKVAAGLLFGFACIMSARGEALLQLFNLSWNQIADKMPEIAEAGYTALWVPPPTKGSSQYSAGYDCFDPFDLGDKNQAGTIPTRYGTKEELLRMVRIAHRFGIRVYLDNVVNHRAYSTPGYDANTPIDIYPGLRPEDFHLQTTPDGFYRQWPDISNYNDVQEVQNFTLEGLCDLSQEQPNANFGPTAYDTITKPVFIRQPNDPEDYPNPNLPGPNGAGINGSLWHAFDGTNGVPVVEDTASYLIRSAMWEMSETKCDGFRMDAVKHVPVTFFGWNLPATNNISEESAGYTGAIQMMYDWVHGYGYNNPISGYNEPDDSRNSCYDTEAIRNDAMIFGEHLGEPPDFSDYLNSGMRLEDIQLHNLLNCALGSPSQGLRASMSKPRVGTARVEIIAISPRFSGRCSSARRITA
jgi:glycosidase